MKSWTRFLPIVLMAMIAVWMGSTWAASVKPQKKVHAPAAQVSAPQKADFSSMEKAHLSGQKLARLFGQYSEEKEYSTLLKRVEEGEELMDFEKARFMQLDERYGQRRECSNPLDNQGGPDGYGYFFVDNQGGDTASYEWIELRGDAEAVWINDISNHDDGYSASKYPFGFSFPFYGTTYDSFRVAVNGFVQFVTSTGTLSNVCLPATGVAGPAVFLFWNDLHLNNGGIPTGTDVVGYKNFGDHFVIEYDSIGSYNTLCAGTLKFEAIFYPNGRIKMQYNQLVIGSGATCDSTMTVGIQANGAAGSDALNYVCNTTGIQPVEQLAIWFFQPNGIPNPVTNLQGSANGTTVTLTWTDPTQDINGNPITVDTVQVWLGLPDQGTRLGAVGAGVQTFVQSNAPQGNNLYSVRTYNDGFDGVYVSVNVIVGNPSYVDDFEASDGGWVADNGWEWGQPTAPDGPQAHSGTNLWGTVLSGDYGLDVCYTLTLNLGTPIESPTATVEFWRWYDTEAHYDGCNFKVSTDQGTTWTIVEPVGGYGDSTNAFGECLITEHAWTGHTGGNWTYVVLPIGQFVGQVAQFRFTFSSDGSITYPGFYFDDMTIWGLGTVNDGPPLPVSNLAAEANGNNVTLTWVDPTEDVIGNPIVVDSIQAWLGAPDVGTYLGSVEAGVQTFTQVNAPNGSNTYYVRPYNNGFVGGSQSVSVIVGNPSYGQDFEADNGGWVPTPETGGWEWGQPTAPDGPQAHSGANVWGTVLAGDYPNSACFNLDLTLGLLVQSPTAYVEFWMWYDTETSFDGCHFKVSTDGGSTWELVTPDGGYPQPQVSSNTCIGANTPCWAGNSGGWVHTTLPIGQYDGQTPIFRFVFGSDGSVTYPGFYFDDMLIWGLQPPYPTGTLAGQTRILSNNQALSDVRVIAVSPDMTDSTLSDAQGFYTVELRTGTYSVTFHHVGYCDSVRTGVLIEDGQTTIMNVSLRAPVANMSVSSITHQGVQGEITSTTFSIDNTGNCDLSYSITDDQTWLSELPASGTIAGSGSQEITVWFDATNLGIGEYNGTMTITHSATGSPVTIPVQLIIPNAAGDAGETLPTEFALNGNYPNPFNAVTEIRYDLPQNARVSLVLYNMLGQEVRHLVNNDVPAGRHTAVWDGRNNSGGGMTSGIYIVRLVAGEHTFTGKVMLLK